MYHSTAPCSVHVQAWDKERAPPPEHGCNDGTSVARLLMCPTLLLLLLLLLLADAALKLCTVGLVQKKAQRASMLTDRPHPYYQKQTYSLRQGLFTDLSHWY